MDEQIKRLDDSLKRAEDAVNGFYEEEKRIRERAQQRINDIETERDKELGRIAASRDSKNKEVTDLKEQREARLQKIEQDAKEARGI